MLSADTTTPGPASNLDIRIANIYIYPIKSCDGIPLSSAPIPHTQKHKRSYGDAFDLENPCLEGLRFDRQWMVIDHNNKPVSQRTTPKLVLAKPQLALNDPNDPRSDGHLLVTAPGMSTTLRLPLCPVVPPGTDPVSVSVWGSSGQGFDCGDEAARWISEFLGKPCRIIFKDPNCARAVVHYLPPPGTCSFQLTTGFAEAYPITFFNQPSIDETNRCLAEHGAKVEHLTFRHSLVFDLAPPGASAGDAKLPPYDEESWRNFELATSSGESIEFYVTARLDRCPMPNVNRETGTMSKDYQPLKAMRTFRTPDPGKPTKVCFGMLAAPIHPPDTVVSVGDRIKVLGRCVHSSVEE
ncbi:hypothetical protein EV182_001706 [Spiromyces aspiralis]|uniref:Uncharacterized protein n=1 Tax=Spiromyces aspiralis TaxID=68401 RepID=A0ACC1HF26_9FUNG|nr:hypothetical protein EV182_001706 [Spiromyces aspiralis]